MNFVNRKKTTTKNLEIKMKFLVKLMYRPTLVYEPTKSNMKKSLTNVFV